MEINEFFKNKDILKEVREKLAEFEHEQWLSWVSYLIKHHLSSVLEQLQSKNIEGASKSLNSSIRIWNEYIKPYKQLPESIKERDREYADKILEIINSSTQAKSKEKKS